ncbi:MAG TPA: ABC transporter ATP-binding protein [Dongiaceae bacterium]|jgi:ABC-2 type transport system ATP-binding protein|nr:ABC transporter ATP-binding protein [Dongiaceae bacterium]
MTMMIAVSGLVFDYPGRRALDEVTFALEENTITALVGPNGAGKTTLLRCLAGLDTPFAGQVSVAGLDVLSEPRLSHRRMGFLADSFGLYDDLSVEQCLLYRAAALGLPAPDRVKAARLAAERLALGDRYRQKVGTLSRGLRQRLAIGETIVHSPDVLLLDEPASGLDPEARLGLAETLRRLRDDGMTIMVSSHILSELEDYSTHMLILRDGRLADQRALSAPSGGTAIMLRLATADARAEAVVKAEGAVSGLIAEGLTLRFHFTGDDLARALLLRRLIEAGLPIADFSIERKSLQHAYLTHVGDTKALR